MRLLLCLACDDVRALDECKRLCRCGRSTGRIEFGEAVVQGPCRVVLMVADPSAPADRPSGWWTTSETTSDRIQVPPLL